MVLKRKEDYEGATEANAWRLLAEVSLSEVRFQEVTALIFEAIGLSVEENEHAPEGSPEDLDVTPPQPMEEIDGLSTHTTMVPV